MEQTEEVGQVRQYMIEELKMPLEHIENTLDRLKKHEDIYAEFYSWLSTRQFPEDGLEIDGYSAQSIAGIQSALSGLAVYLLLVGLRDDRERTIGYLQEGLPIL